MMNINHRNGQHGMITIKVPFCIHKLTITKNFLFFIELVEFICLEINMYIHMHVTTTDEKCGHKFERKQRKGKWEGLMGGEGRVK